jgi:hypothetical protein
MQQHTDSLASLEREQLCLYKRLEDRASGWVGLVCGSWYILYLRCCLVCGKCCMKSINVNVNVNVNFNFNFNSPSSWRTRTLASWGKG